MKNTNVILDDDGCQVVLTNHAVKEIDSIRDEYESRSNAIERLAVDSTKPISWIWKAAMFMFLVETTFIGYLAYLRHFSH